MIENVLVGLIVSIAAAYAAWKFVPAGVRARVAPRLVQGCRRLGLSPSLSIRLEKKLESGGACGSCNSCNACATDPASVPEAKAAPLVRTRSQSARRVIPIARDENLL